MKTKRLQLTHRRDRLPFRLPPLVLLRPLRMRQPTLALQVGSEGEEMILLGTEVALEVADLVVVALLQIPEIRRINIRNSTATMTYWNKGILELFDAYTSTSDIKIRDSSSLCNVDRLVTGL